jgi:hypothetical protein
MCMVLYSCKWTKKYNLFISNLIEKIENKSFDVLQNHMNNLKDESLLRKNKLYNLKKIRKRILIKK